MHKNKRDNVIDIYNINKRNLLFSDNKAANGVYGHSHVLLDYIGENADKSCLTCPIEHGLTIANKFLTATEHTNASNYIITNSLYNKMKINAISKKKVIVIGPYIAYANLICSFDELMECKKKNGRTLLVFPSHGIQGFEPKFDILRFINEIEKVRKDFKTVIVCMYFHDVLCNYHKPYEKRGYKVACAGNGQNTHFLEKLKTIIQLSDAVIANSYTTGLQYAIYMKKPVYVVDNLNFKWENKSYNNVDKMDQDLCEIDNLKKFYELCGNPDFTGLNEQIAWGKYMFGIEEVKNKEELKSLLCPVIRRF